MSTQDPITPSQALASPRYDDDIHALMRQAGLGDFPYHNVAQHERLAVNLARWPLLIETTLARSGHDT